MNLRLRRLALETLGEVDLALYLVDVTRPPARRSTP